jgi:hypothetical protein
MCGKSKSSPPPPAPAPAPVVHEAHAENVADNSNAIRQQSIASSSTAQNGSQSFGSELGASTTPQA